MGRARRAQRIAGAAAYGGGGLAALGAASWALIRAEAAIAKRIIGEPIDNSPNDNGVYGAGPGSALNLVVLGDSTAAGLGVTRREETVGATLATGVAAFMGRPVRLTNRAVVGAESSDLMRQLADAAAVAPNPSVVVIMVGANDVTHRIDRALAVRSLEDAVRQARARGSEVVVGTCPDLGTIRPIAQPLRTLVRRWSRDLAAAQTVAVVEAGGRAVSFGDLLGPEFAASPSEMFGPDQFHPSAAGYARAAAALLPTVLAAVDPGRWEHEPSQVATDQHVNPLAVAAGYAALSAGTEVAPADVSGPTRGPRGLWAQTLRRRGPVPSAEEVEEAYSLGDEENAETANRG